MSFVNKFYHYLSINVLLLAACSIYHDKCFWIVGLQIFGGLQVVISTGVWSKVERRLCNGEASTKG